MKTRAKTWDIENIFAIPLKDGTYTLGQVVGREKEVLNSITCAFYKTRFNDLELKDISIIPNISDLLSVQFVSPDLLKSRKWVVLGKEKVNIPKAHFPYEETRKNGWVGAKVIGSGIMVHFLNAYYGLEPWDMMYKPDYFDKLLINNELKPSDLLYKNAT